MTLSKRHLLNLSTGLLALASLILFVAAGCGQEGAVPPATGKDAVDAHAGEAKGETHDDHGEEGGEESHGEEGHVCSADHAEGEPHAPCTTCPNQKSSANWIIVVIRAL